MKKPPMTTLPFSPRMLIDPSRSFGRVAVVASSTPSAPESNRTTATPVSSHSIFTRRVAAMAPDRFDRSHEPRQHVDVVGRLIHEDAAVVRPRAAPRLRVVVGLVAGPPQPHGAQHQTPEPTLVQRLAGLDDRRVVAILVDDEQLHAVQVARLDHPIGVLEPERHRLLDDNRTAVLRQLEHVLAVRAATA